MNVQNETVQERPGVLAATCLSMRNNAPAEHCVAEAYYENRFANLIIIMRAISSPFYRQFLAELPIKSILHREKSTHDETGFHFARVSHD